jgi:hypothetical protein
LGFDLLWRERFLEKNMQEIRNLQLPDIKKNINALPRALFCDANVSGISL